MAKGLLRRRRRVIDSHSLTRAHLSKGVAATLVADQAVDLVDAALHVVEARDQYRALDRTDLVGLQAVGNRLHIAHQALDAVEDLVRGGRLGRLLLACGLAAGHSRHAGSIGGR